MTEAPLFVQTLALAQWLLANFAGEDPLARRVHGNALDLLDHVVLALKGFGREEQVDEADRSAALLRVHLRLALELRRLDEDRYLYLAEEMDGIGRQIGGWQKRLLSDTISPRHR